MTQNSPIAIDHSQEAATLQALPEANLQFSYKTKLAGVYLEAHSSPAHETAEHYPIQHVITIQTAGTVQAERRLDEQFRHELISVGDVCVVPAHTQHWIRSQGEQSLLFLSFAPFVLKQVAPESTDPDRIEITPHFAKPDPLMHQLGLALKTALQADPVDSQIYAESLSIALAAHLVQYYATRKQLLQIINDTPQTNIQQAIDYIHAHLTQDLSLDGIAKTVGISQYHFSRLFKQSTGTTLWQYVVRQRIQLAKQLLAQSGQSIVEVSDRLGFSSQGQFANFFRKHTGVTPTQYRQKL